MPSQRYPLRTGFICQALYRQYRTDYAHSGLRSPTLRSVVTRIPKTYSYENPTNYVEYRLGASMKTALQSDLRIRLSDPLQTLITLVCTLWSKSPRCIANSNHVCVATFYDGGLCQSATMLSHIRISFILTFLFRAVIICAIALHGLSSGQPLFFSPIIGPHSRINVLRPTSLGTSTLRFMGQLLIKPTRLAAIFSPSTLHHDHCHVHAGATCHLLSPLGASQPLLCVAKSQCSLVANPSIGSALTLRSLSSPCYIFGGMTWCSWCIY